MPTSDIPLVLTLVADGPSDRCLLRILNWWTPTVAAMQHCRVSLQLARFDLLRQPPRSLRARLEAARSLFPCDILLVHRDAEGRPPADRLVEIEAAAREARFPTCIPVVPVRMTEAWLLIDEPAIRAAAGNPRGTMPLELPPLRRLEELSNPKQALEGAILRASGKSGRRLAILKRDIRGRVQRVAEYIRDFGPLRDLVAFQEFEARAIPVLDRMLGGRLGAAETRTAEKTT